MPEATIAASYERVSTLIQAQQGYSLGTQRKDATQFATENNLVLPDDLRFRDGEEHSASGADWNLPWLNAMLNAAKERRFEILLVPSHDRFARNMTKALVLEEQLQQYGVRVVYMNVAVDDTPEGRLLRNQLHAFSEYDREKRKLVSMRNRQAKAAMGRWVGGGPTPYGYRCVRESRGADRKGRVVGLEIIESEAMVLRDLYRRALTDSIYVLAARLNGLGVIAPGYSRAKRGTRNHWSHATVGGLLHNRLYMGEGHYGPHAIKVPPIVDATLFDSVELALAERHRRPSFWRTRQEQQEDPFLLRGRLRCGHCTGLDRDVILRCDLVASGGDHIRYYTCPYRYASRLARTQATTTVCDLPNMPAELIEARAWEDLSAAIARREEFERDLLDSEERHAAALKEHASRLEAFRAQIQKAQRRLDYLVSRRAELVSGDDDEEIGAVERNRAEALRQIAGLREEEAALVANVGERSKGLSAADVTLVRQAIQDLEPDFDGVTVADRRQLLDLLDVVGVVHVDVGESKLSKARPRGWHASVTWYSRIRVRTDRSVLKYWLVLTRSGLRLDRVERLAQEAA
jgi:DNA invertase Pin-like site-specific DNA recombinase